MTKAALVRETAKRAKVTQAQAEAVIMAALEAAVDALTAGQEVKLNQYGTFKVRQRKPHMSHNFTTGEHYQTHSLKTVLFTPSEILRKRIDGAGEGNENE